MESSSVRVASAEGLCKENLELQTHGLPLLKALQEQSEERPGHKLFLFSSPATEAPHSVLQ